MKLVLNSLKIKNIKGIQEVDSKLSNTHIIDGANGIGKTTLLDIISWLLTGQSDIRNNKFVPDVIGGADDLEQEASLNTSINGNEYTFTIRRNTQTEALKYLVNNEKLGKNKYLQKLEALGISDIKELMNPNYLLDILNWKDARNYITTLLDMPSTDSLKTSVIASGVAINYITTAEELDWDYDRVKDETSTVKGAIEVLTTNLKHEESKLDTDVDVTVLELRRDKLYEDRKAIEDDNDKSIIDDKIADAQKIIDTNEAWMVNLQVEFDNFKKQQNDLNAEIVKVDSVLKTQIKLNEEHASTPITYVCNICNQDLPTDIIEHARKKHSESMALKVKQHEELVKQKDNLKAKYLKITTEAAAHHKQNESIAKSTMMMTTTTRERLVGLVAKSKEMMDTDKLKKLDDDILEVNNQIAKHGGNIKEMIDSLKTQLAERHTRQENLVGAKEAIKVRNSLRATSIKNQLATYFPGLDIIITKELKNGKIEPTFTVSKGGINYSSLNSAAKVQTGILITHGLQKMLGKDYPLLIDNGEALTTRSWEEVMSTTLRFVMTRVK